MAQENLYKSVLHTLSLLPEPYLVQVNAYLNALQEKVSQKEENREAILSLAGGWSGMLEEDFQEYLTIAKGSGEDLFGKEVEL